METKKEKNISYTDHFLKKQSTWHILYMSFKEDPNSPFLDSCSTHTKIVRRELSLGSFLYIVAKCV